MSQLTTNSMPFPDRTPNGPTRIMHLIPRYINDGTCRVVDGLIKYTDRGRFQVYVGILSKDNRSLQPLIDMGAKPVQFDMKHFANVSVLPALIRELRDKNIQILHTHRIRPDLIGRIASHWANVPVNVSTQHYAGEWNERGRFVGRAVSLLYRLTLPCTKKIVNISHGEMARLGTEKIPESKMAVIHNGVDGELFFPTSKLSDHGALNDESGRLIIGCVAYLTKRKGIHHLIDAFGQVADRVPQAHLQIVGDGEQRNALESQIVALGLTERVTLLGNRTDIPRLMNAFDIFVLPSVWEPFGLVIAEAMACAKPVVATNVGGIPEIVADNRTGFLVRPGEVSALADVLVALLRDARLRVKLGQAGRQRFLEEFDSRVMAAKYQALYESLL